MLGLPSVIGYELQLEWSQIYEYGGSRDEFYYVNTTSDGGFVMAGVSTVGPGGLNMWILKADENGNKSWEEGFGGDEHDFAYCVKEIRDGNYSLAGRYRQSSDNDACLVKVDSDGDDLWMRRYDENEWDEAYSVVQTANGSYLIGTTTFGLIFANQNGVMQSNISYGYTPTCIRPCSDGNYFLLGSRSSYARMTKIRPNGAVIWDKTYGKRNGDHFRDICEMSDGSLAIVGDTTSYGYGGSDTWLMKTNGTGDELWNRTYGGSKYERGYFVSETPELGLVFGGWTTSYAETNGDAWVLLVNSTGEEIDNVTVEAGHADYFRHGARISSTEFVACGVTNVKGSEDGWLCKFSIQESSAPPATPETLAGPASGQCNISYDFSVNTSDPEGDDVRYIFDWGDGNGTTTALFPSDQTVDISYCWLRGGTFSVKVMAEDENEQTSGWSEPCEITIYNEVPEVPEDLSGTGEGIVQELYQFSVSTMDPDGHKVKYRFDWGDGKNTTTLSVQSEEVVNATHKWKTRSTFQIRVKAIDEYGAMSNWSVPLNITIVNLPPTIPNCTVPSSITVGHHYYLQSISNDWEGDEVRYTVNWGDDEPEMNTSMTTCNSTMHIYHLWNMTGVFEVWVMSTDEYGNSSQWSGPHHVNVTNLAPLEPSNVQVPLQCRLHDSINLSATASDPDGHRIGFEFDWGDGTITKVTEFVESGEWSDTTNIWDTPGTFEVKVRTHDPYGMFSNWSEPVNITIISRDPDVPTVAGPVSGWVNTNITLTLNGSDIDGDDLFLTIDWGDDTITSFGPIASGAAVNVSNTWSETGNFSIVCTASDGLGGVSPGNKPFGITILSRPPKLTNLPDGPSEGEVNRSCLFTFFPIDPDGDDIDIRIDWGDGPIITMTVSSGYRVDLSKTWDTADEYDVTISLTDEHGIEGNMTTFDVRIYKEMYHRPGPPLSPNATAYDDHIKINWSVPNTDGNLTILHYYLYRNEGAGSYIRIGTINDSLSYDDLSVSHGTTYHYQITSVNGEGESVRNIAVNATWVASDNEVTEEETPADFTIPVLIGAVIAIVVAIVLAIVFFRR